MDRSPLPLPAEMHPLGGGCPPPSYQSSAGGGVEVDLLLGPGGDLPSKCISELHPHHPLYGHNPPVDIASIVGLSVAIASASAGSGDKRLAQDGDALLTEPNKRAEGERKRRKRIKQPGPVDYSPQQVEAVYLSPGMDPATLPPLELPASMGRKDKGRTGRPRKCDYKVIKMITREGPAGETWYMKQRGSGRPKKGEEIVRFQVPFPMDVRQDPWRYRFVDGHLETVAETAPEKTPVTLGHMTWEEYHQLATGKTDIAELSLAPQSSPPPLALNPVADFLPFNLGSASSSAEAAAHTVAYQAAKAAVARQYGAAHPHAELDFASPYFHHPFNTEAAVVPAHSDPPDAVPLSPASTLAAHAAVTPPTPPLACPCAPISTRPS
mmetsp:Transcript_8432/g.21551  ORF Transcript_8432/g.21551 Transcript_8432/m.21551 type:complete len:381 (+) Transcript_8432:87-1229(+)